MKKLTLTNVAVYDRLSEETVAFSANLLIDGVKVGQVSNDGKGGCHRYDLTNGHYSAVRDLVAAEPERDLEMDINKLVSVAREAKILKRAVKKAVIFTRKNAPGKQFSLKYPAGAEKATIDRIRSTEGDNLGMIANEDVEAFADVLVTEVFAALDAEYRSQLAK